MSISPAQMVLQVGSGAGPDAATRSTSILVSAAPAVEAPTESPARAPAVTSTQFSTDLRVDDRHRIYYEVINDRTGDVLFEIPPPAFREIGESLGVTLDGNASGHNVDVKS